MDDFCPQKGVEIMNGKNTYGVGILFLVIFLSVPLSGCLMTTGMPTGNTSQGPPPWAHGSRAQHHYRYYPYYSIYFDEQRGVYYYLSDARWQMSVSLPSYIQITVNDFVTLDMDTDKPYEYHNDVVKRYPPGQEKKKDQDIDRNKSQDKAQDKSRDTDKNKSQGNDQNKSQDTDKNKSQDKGQDKSQDIDKNKPQGNEQNKSQDTDKNKSQDKGQDKSQDTDKNKSQDKDKDKSKDKDKDITEDQDNSQGQDNYQDKKEDGN
jgi:hypothetical protein